MQADRARIAEGLDTGLNAQIVEMGAAAERGTPGACKESHGTSDARPSRRRFQRHPAARQRTLAHMRRVVGTCSIPKRRRAPRNPASASSTLCWRVPRGADIRLHITGAPKVLPSGLELSAYRTLEHLLDAYKEDPWPAHRHRSGLR